MRNEPHPEPGAWRNDPLGRRARRTVLRLSSVVLLGVVAPGCSPDGGASGGRRSDGRDAGPAASAVQAMAGITAEFDGEGATFFPEHAGSLRRTGPGAAAPCQ